MRQRPGNLSLPADPTGISLDEFAALSQGRRKRFPWARWLLPWLAPGLLVAVLLSAKGNWLPYWDGRHVDGVTFEQALEHLRNPIDPGSNTHNNAPWTIQNKMLTALPEVREVAIKDLPGLSQHAVLNISWLTVHCLESLVEANQQLIRFQAMEGLSQMRRGELDKRQKILLKAIRTIQTRMEKLTESLPKNR